MKRLLYTISAFAFFCILLWWLGAYNFVYLEHLATFYYHWPSIWAQLSSPGGLAAVTGDFLVQFFVSPFAAVVISAALLSLVAALTADIARALRLPPAFLPLTLLPSLALAFVHYNINYSYAGTIAFAITLGCIDLLVHSRAFFCNHRAALFVAIPAALAFLWWACGSPADFFNRRQPVPSIAFLPWATLAAVLFASPILTLIRFKRIGAIIAFTLSVAAVAIFALMGKKSYINSDNEVFKELNCYIRANQWQKVIDKCGKLPMTNLLHQNCLNLALAETGQLADSLFTHPNYDIRSIYITGESTPYIYMLLSDVYYSMGHIALARRHAFEANECLDNRSPRMLQRLADSAVAFADYPVAEKYLALLSTTLYYSEWAQTRRNLIEQGRDDGDNADFIALCPEIALKRRCIPPANRFSAYGGLDADLMAVARVNPEHPATAQYIGALYLLSKDLPRFGIAVAELYGESPLPRAFAEGALMLADRYDIPDSVAFNINPSDSLRYRSFLAAPSSQPSSFWHFYRFTP